MLAIARKLSRDPRFEDKLLDVVGLYLNPPEHAFVLSCDEKSQIQVLNRTQPGLPMKSGRAGTVTHDYKRHIADHNARPKPFVWTASVSDILAKVTRAKAALTAVPR